ncbi:L-fucose/L-arabinose isomerase family protein [Candidatus Bipolaricaulota bacterium]|nr:L-fucose/L-arabinose isomerase family protein [Candidatus Bipolaricaulota bacterium]
MRKVGVMTFSDGRKSVHEEELETNRAYEEKLVKALKKTGEVEVVTTEKVIWSSELARRKAQELVKKGVEMTIFNFAVWSFPHLVSIAAEFAPGPYLLFSNINPEHPGMVGMLASAGALDQIGEFHGRVWGDIEDDEVLDKVMSFVRSTTAVNRLRGEAFGLFGGRPMGMYTAVSNLDQWRKKFGVDVEHIDQMEIVNRASEVSTQRARDGRRWLENRVKEIHYDGEKLTPEKLEKQVRSYHAVREIAEEKYLDFLGIKAQPELTDSFATMDVTEAFLNDPYDWEGAHEPIVSATEADMDGALTMEILKHLSGKPVLFADVRHYDAEDDFFDLVNSGAHATYYAGQSTDPEENLKQVEFYPEGLYFPAGGASVRHIAAPGIVTMARLARKDGSYWLAIVPGEFLEFPSEKAEKKAKATTNEWPHAFARLETSAEEFLSEYGSNHIHGIYGDWVSELVWVAKSLGMNYKIFDDKNE